MTWRNDYQRKQTTAVEAVQLVKSGDRIFTSGNVATPRLLLRALVERKQELERVELVHLLLIGDEFSAPGLEKHFRHNALFVGPGDRLAVNMGKADYTPIFLSEIPQLFTARTLPLGIGAIPDAVLASLTEKHDLGIHTEMISDGVMQAMEAGIVTGEKKTLHPGKAIATLILGSRDLYRFADNNPAFEPHPSSYTNDPFIIAQHNTMIAINSALEVDLTGQVCADSIGTTIYSGFGGQLDFIRGAARSRGGKPIIALPATARGEEFSRIVPLLKPGAGVVTTRGDVHYVVTEFGVAELYGKTLRQRARALINVAHPRFRAELERAAWERHLL